MFSSLKKCFLFSLIKMFPLLFLFLFSSFFFLVSSFLRCRCCPDDTGRDSWDWVGPPTRKRARSNSPEWGGGFLLVKKEPLQIGLLLLLLLIAGLLVCWMAGWLVGWLVGGCVLLLGTRTGPVRQANLLSKHARAD